MSWFSRASCCVEGSQGWMEKQVDEGERNEGKQRMAEQLERWRWVWVVRGIVKAVEETDNRGLGKDSLGFLRFWVRCVFLSERVKIMSVLKNVLGHKWNVAWDTESFAASWLLISNPGHNEPLNNHEKDVKIQKENEGCVCDFAALKAHCEINILNSSSATMKSAYICLLGMEFICDVLDSGSWGILHLILWCSPGEKQLIASCIWEKKNTYRLWYKNVQMWCMRMGPNNLPALS